MGLFDHPPIDLVSLAFLNKLVILPGLPKGQPGKENDGHDHHDDGNIIGQGYDL